MFRLLVLENEEDRIVVQSRLKLRFDLTFAEECDDVITWLRKECFDCLIMNVSFGEKKLFNIFEYIKQNNLVEEMPVIIVADKGHENIDEGILDYEISEIIQKPYGRYTLIKRIDNIINLFKQNKELKISNQELEAAYEKAKEAVELKTKFILNMSHDLRTPMNAIIGMTDMTKKYLDDTPKAEEYLDNVIAASDHLLNVINGILDMSYIESGNKINSLTECNISEIIRDISVIVKQQCDKAKLNYELSLKNVVNENIWVNATRLKQLFINILGNSVKFTNAGGTVGIHIRELPAEKNSDVKYQFKFYDTGKGMSKKFMKTMFLPFEREESNKGPYVEGTGLGLAITKSIVDSMGGSIKVNSKIGVGSSFTITLEFEKGDNEYIGDRSFSSTSVYVYHQNGEKVRNIAAALETIGVNYSVHDNLDELLNDLNRYNVVFAGVYNDDTDSVDKLNEIVQLAPDIKIININDGKRPCHFEGRLQGYTVYAPYFPSEIHSVMKTAVNEEDNKTNNEYSFDKIRILVVDDNNINRMIAMEFLQAVNIECVEASGGKEAIDILKKAEKGYFDMVLMDVQMPDLDGCEITRIIRELKEGYHAGVPIVAMTADVFAEDKARVIKSGMNAHLSKPFKREELYRCIEMYTNK